MVDLIMGFPIVGCIILKEGNSSSDLAVSWALRYLWVFLEYTMLKGSLVFAVLLDISFVENFKQELDCQLLKMLP